MNATPPSDCECANCDGFSEFVDGLVRVEVMTRDRWRIFSGIKWCLLGCGLYGGVFGLDAEGVALMVGIAVGGVVSFLWMEVGS